ncbi:phytoene/squalene synthase family protein [Solirubrobacter taibaiensis]|nr:phytoene/squalene synthase family protein [Solirubrobacter taibaiensis]
MSAVLDEARATTRQVARTFALACRILPRDVRDDVYLLYLMFRTLDDLVDEGRVDAPDRIDAVVAWAVGDEEVLTPETTILSDLATRHELPRDALLDFCAGMSEDLDGVVYESEADVDRYCYRVAGTVGIVMSAVLGVSDPARARPAAAALGMAMQRTNILRDIDEDVERGRVYFARSTLDRFGSLAPGSREALLRDQIARADALYDQGIAGIRELRRGRRAIAAAADMYRELLRQLEAEGYGSRPGRAIVPRSRKLRLAARAAWRA